MLLSGHSLACTPIIAYYYVCISLEAKSIDLALSSPKLSLAYYCQTNHIYYKNLHSTGYLYVDRQDIYHWYGEKDHIQQLMTCH